jgi:hypothetical protein
MLPGSKVCLISHAFRYQATICFSITSVMCTGSYVYTEAGVTKRYGTTSLTPQNGILFKNAYKEYLFDSMNYGVSRVR